MLQLALFSTLAFTSNVRLLTAEDAPVADVKPASEAEAPAAAVKSHPPPIAKQTPNSEIVSQPLPWAYQMAAGSAAAIVVVPTSLYLSQWVGSLSNNTIWAALPALLCMGLIPPLAISFATTLAGNWNAPGKYRFLPAFLVTLVINGISLPLAALGGLSVGVVGRIIIYTLAQAVVQPGAATLVQRAFPRGEEAPTVITAHDPNAPETFFVPLQTSRF